MTLLIIAVIGAYLMALCAFAYCIHVAVVYQRFNDGIKDWANALDESTRSAIDRQAMEILRQLDQRIIEQKELEKLAPTDEEIEFVRNYDVEPLNINDDEKD